MGIHWSRSADSTLKRWNKSSTDFGRESEYMVLQQRFFILQIRSDMILSMKRAWMRLIIKGFVKYMKETSIMTGSRNHIPVYNQMFKEQSKIIKKLAGYGSGVFLGRCADCIKRWTRSVLRVSLCRGILPYKASVEEKEGNGNR